MFLSSDQFDQDAFVEEKARVFKKYGLVNQEEAIGSVKKSNNNNI